MYICKHISNWSDISDVFDDAVFIFRKEVNQYAKCNDVKAKREHVIQSLTLI